MRPKTEELASQLADQLSRAGFAVWNAAEEIAPGDNWAKEIGRALDESDVMVALITRGALESEFLRGDIQYGLTSKNLSIDLFPFSLVTSRLWPARMCRGFS